MKTEKKKAIAYARVSTNEQMISPKDQEEKLSSYCKFKDLKLVDILIETGISGGVPLFERPQGMKLLDAKVDAIVATKLDRLFRDAADCLSVTKKWDEKAVALHLIDMGGNSFDTSSAMGRMFLTMAAGFAEMERGLIHERTSAALQHLKKDGKRISGHLPYGYDLDKDGTHLIENTDELYVLNVIVKLRERGESLRAIGAILEAKGIKPKRGGEKWQASALQSIIERSVLPDAVAKMPLPADF